MKTIGLIGGMSWESSIEYYRLINELAKARLGGLHSAKCVMYSVDFAEIETLQHQERWQEASLILIDAAQAIERAGADFVVLCTNTMHKLADEIQANLQIPFLHIADATAQRIQAARIDTIGLLGTRYTMEQDFYRGRLEQHGIKVLVPDAADRAIVHDVIYSELCLGIIQPDSRSRYLAIIDRLISAGAEGIILGCTEIELLIQPEDCEMTLFPTTRIHAEAAIDWALANA
ncbi:aspartate/glutamate racemase family protein [Leptolyngbya sp. FACHB-711]|uniref:aspartate/glutamate racemase family protein n=1 Tax=Leptolyngbya sp. FACHB-711 TaxID=2692813 RepID=UPI00168717BF|nr:aspartate/glutamate racemase family protein [Leptolyngbya sp. FACHB-711]MBD1850934.1 aspartate/glutamate racemase family protein [Cyanobacteria bacterium FACHB-502]MBD2026841.1 aspartate/glutamate racemase family protein [Leptolyngbya sp. FACHB-711]